MPRRLPVPEWDDLSDSARISVHGRNADVERWIQGMEARIKRASLPPPKEPAWKPILAIVAASLLGGGGGAGVSLGVMQNNIAHMERRVVEHAQEGWHSGAGERIRHLEQELAVVRAKVDEAARADEREIRALRRELAEFKHEMRFYRRRGGQ